MINKIVKIYVDKDKQIEITEPDVVKKILERSDEFLIAYVTDEQSESLEIKYQLIELDSDKIRDVDTHKAYVWIMLLVIGAVSTIGLSLALSYYLQIYAIVPFAIIMVGILIFFCVLTITNYLSGTKPLKSGEIRQAITASIVVVYLGLLPILAFKGIINFEILSVQTPLINETATQALNQTVQNDVEFTESVITNFTALVTAVILFYFAGRTIDNYVDKHEKNK